jgi:hypothetical protein
MSFKGPNKLWIAADRSSYIEHDPATGSVNIVNNGITAATLDSSGLLGVRRQIIADAASVQLTAAQSGALCVFDKTDGAAFLLPAAEVGLTYDFALVASAASVGYRVACTSGDFIIGSILLDDSDSGLATTAQAFNGSTHLAIDINAATDGWLAGGFFRLTAISASQWAISGHLLHTGNVASPAATS